MDSNYSIEILKHPFVKNEKYDDKEIINRKRIMTKKIKTKIIELMEIMIDQLLEKECNMMTDDDLKKFL